jgi:hypothetical protein
MNISRIEKKVGTYSDRQRKNLELAGELKDLLSDNYLTYGPFEINEEKNKADKKLGKESVLIEFRAKTSEAILNKLNRFGEALEEMLDIFGIRLVAYDVFNLEKTADLIKSSLWKKPSDEEMTIRGGKMLFSSFRDYRKRDWEGASPLTSGGYDEAIHINRKTKYGICEIQIMTKNLYSRYYGNSDEGHAQFKKRQAENFIKDKITKAK